MKNNISIIEGLLFLSGDDGISKDEITKVLNIDHNLIQEYIDGLNNTYKKNNHVFEIVYNSNSYKLCTKKDYYDYFKSYAKEIV